jgi:predicted amidohydrolase
MNVGFVQFAPLFDKKERNLNRAGDLIAKMKADVIVLPELFNTGYTFINKNELAKLSEEIPGETSDFIKSIAKCKKCCITYGFAERAKNGFFNSMALIKPDGSISCYRKSHLFNEEKKFFLPGNTGFNITEYKSIKLGMLCCFDWLFPEAMRTLALKGAQIVLHSANLVLPWCQSAILTRALENRIFIITANRIGTERRSGKLNRFTGHSQIVAPDGKLLVRVKNSECVRVVNINPKLALNKRVNKYNDIFKDRRRELYLY